MTITRMAVYKDKEGIEREEVMGKYNEIKEMERNEVCKDLDDIFREMLMSYGYEVDEELNIIEK